MNERPILFSAPMVNAILEGRKTQTRRVIKPQPETRSARYGDVEESNVHPGEFFQWQDGGDRRLSFTCPFGVLGDRLWVREKHLAFIQKVYHIGGTDSNQRVIYAADGGSLLNGAKWKPSIFMPRWASRITLELTGVRVERLQDISEADAAAEGCSAHYGSGPYLSAFGGRRIINNYAALWDSIKGKNSGAAWADNPWVWVLEFGLIPR